MKKDIHPTYYQDAVIKCACGKVHHIPSTVKEMHVELCSNCHPYYTGTAKMVDSARRIDKFQARLEKARAVQEKVKTARAQKTTVNSRQSTAGEP